MKRLFLNPIAVACVAALVILWAGIPLFVRLLAGTWQDSGAIGDTFNVSNALFTAVALLGVVYTLLTQQTEANRRDQEIRAQQAAMTQQILHLGRATKLRAVQSMIEDHRRAIVELRPRTGTVPRSLYKLQTIRAEVAAELLGEPYDERAKEVLHLLDSLVELQTEISKISQWVEDVENQFNA